MFLVLLPVCCHLCQEISCVLLVETDLTVVSSFSDVASKKRDFFPGVSVPVGRRSSCCWIASKILLTVVSKEHEVVDVDQYETVPVGFQVQVV